MALRGQQRGGPGSGGEQGPGLKRAGWGGELESLQDVVTAYKERVFKLIIGIHQYHL